MDKMTKLTHLRALALRSKALVGEVAKAATEAIAEVANVKADLASFQTATLDPAGWIKNTDAATSAAGYGFRYALAVPGAAEKDSAECIIDPPSVQAASACGMCPTTDVAAGKIYLYAAAIPEAGIKIQMRLIPGAV